MLSSNNSPERQAKESKESKDVCPPVVQGTFQLTPDLLDISRDTFIPLTVVTLERCAICKQLLRDPAEERERHRTKTAFEVVCAIRNRRVMHKNCAAATVEEGAMYSVHSIVPLWDCDNSSSAMIEWGIVGYSVEPSCREEWMHSMFEAARPYAQRVHDNTDINIMDVTVWHSFMHDEDSDLVPFSGASSITIMADAEWPPMSLMDTAPFDQASMVLAYRWIVVVQTVPTSDAGRFNLPILLNAMGPQVKRPLSDVSTFIDMTKWNALVIEKDTIVAVVAVVDVHCSALQLGFIKYLSEWHEWTKRIRPAIEKACVSSLEDNIKGVAFHITFVGPLAEVQRIGEHKDDDHDDGAEVEVEEEKGKGHQINVLCANIPPLLIDNGHRSSSSSTYAIQPLIVLDNAYKLTEVLSVVCTQEITHHHIVPFLVRTND
jgi:hypothetical protein